MAMAATMPMQHQIAETPGGHLRSGPEYFGVVGRGTVPVLSQPLPQHAISGRGEIFYQLVTSQ